MVFLRPKIMNCAVSRHRENKLTTSHRHQKLLAEFGMRNLRKLDKNKDEDKEPTVPNAFTPLKNLPMGYTH